MNNIKTPEDEAFEELEVKLMRKSAPATARYVRLTPTGEQHEGIDVVDATDVTAEIEQNAAHSMALIVELTKLRAFARDAMDGWQEVGADGFWLGELAIKHGLIAPTTQFKPCAEEGCTCAALATPAEFQGGVTCYRETALLKGHQ